MSEHVLVVPTSRFRQLGDFQGVKTQGLEVYQEGLLTQEYFSYLPRQAAEKNEFFKQLIPYCVFVCGTQIFNYFRTKKSGDERLRGKRSIGVGGHIQSTDELPEGSQSGFEFYRNAMLREIEEEVSTVGVTSEKLLGFVNEDDTPVGRVHLGMVHIFKVIRPDVKSKEDSLLDACFTELSELNQHIEEFELWSQLVLKEITLRACFGSDKI